MKVSGRAALFGFTVLLVVLTRLPFFPAHLFSFDSVNLALSLEHFDPTLHQPQPPGYPAFVLEARLFNLLCGDPRRTFVLLTVLICGFAVAMAYLVGKEMFSPWAGMAAAALLFVNPAFWYSSLTSPLRPHLALVSAIVAYLCWRTRPGESRPLYAASLALGVGGGFRPELFVLLFPMWVWAAWQTRERRAIIRSALMLGGAALVWTGVLMYASGGPQRMIAYFVDYVLVNTGYTSVVLDPATSWRRAAGRAVVWTGLGTLPWIWTLPLAWKERHSTPDGLRKMAFLAVWFAPGFLYLLAVHIGDPDHALGVIPPLCLLGGFAITQAERRVARTWLPQLAEHGLLIWIALVGNLVLFFGELRLPQRNAAAEFRGLASVSDAVRIGVYESSYARVRWIEQMTALGLQGINDLKNSADRPIVVLWARDGEPAWRKISYYMPLESLYVLEESGDPGVRSAEARFYSGNRLVTRYAGQSPFRLPVPDGARLIWVAGANTVESLRKVLPLKAFSTLQYVDLPAGSAPIRWGSFEIVPE